jgi:hypothetical protein
MLKDKTEKNMSLKKTSEPFKPRLISKTCYLWNSRPKLS